MTDKTDSKGKKNQQSINQWIKQIHNQEHGTTSQMAQMSDKGIISLKCVNRQTDSKNFSNYPCSVLTVHEQSQEKK